MLNNALPLLTAVRPAELATTLGAVNQALTGRGEQLGDTLVALHNYLSRLNPALPELSADIRALPRFTDTNAESLPDLVEAAQNLTTNTRTLPGKATELVQAGSYGSFFNFYLCGLSGVLDVPGRVEPLRIQLAQNPAERCRAGGGEPNGRSGGGR